MSVNEEKIKHLLYTYRTTGDMKACDALYMESLRLIKGVICKTIRDPNKNNSELIEEYLGVACVGFYKAVEAFDLNKLQDEKYFFAYASICIKNSLLQEIKKQNRHTSSTISIYENIKGTDDLTIEDTLEDKDNDIENYIEGEHELYKKKKILEAISKLNDKEKEIIMAYYGFNGRVLNVRQISNMFNVSEASISSALNSLNRFLAEELAEFKEEYSAKNERNDLKRTYDSKEQRKTTPIRYRWRSKNGLSLSEKRKIERYEFLVEKYSENKVREAIDLLPERNKRMLYLYYGIDGKFPKTQEELSRLFNLVNIDYAISSSMDRVETFLKEHDIDVYVTNNKGKKLNELIEKYGVEKIREEIAKLEEADRKLIEEYYAFGSRRKIDKSKSELSKKFNISNVPSRVYNLLNMIDKRLQNNYLSKEERCLRSQEEKMKKYNELVLRYGEERVIDAITKLGERNSKIMFLYYGIGVERPMSQIQLGELFNLKKSAISSVIMTSYDKLLKMLKGRNENSNCSSLEKKEHKLNYLISTYGQRKVVDAICKLSERDSKIMLLYFGIGEERPKTQKELSEMFGIKRSTINMVVINSYNRIEKELEKDCLPTSTRKR